MEVKKYINFITEDFDELGFDLDQHQSDTYDDNLKAWMICFNEEKDWWFKSATGIFRTNAHIVLGSWDDCRKFKTKEEAEKYLNFMNESRKDCNFYRYSKKVSRRDVKPPVIVDAKDYVKIFYQLSCYSNRCNIVLTVLRNKDIKTEIQGGYSREDLPHDLFRDYSDAKNAGIQILEEELEIAEQNLQAFKDNTEGEKYRMGSGSTWFKD